MTAKLADLQEEVDTGLDAKKELLVEYDDMIMQFEVQISILHFLI